MNQKTTDDFFIMLCPTRDGKAFIDTITLIFQVAHRLGREPMIVSCDGTTYWDARNNVIAKLRKTLRIHNIAIRDPIRALWIDSDIIIDETLEDLASTLGESDLKGINLIANYKTMAEDGKVVNTIMLPNGDGTYKTASDSELADLRSGKLSCKLVGGLGFYYGFVPLGHEYRIYPPYKTEDICFYIECNIDPQLAPIRLLHNKNVMI